jgi:hypothetical protein
MPCDAQGESVQLFAYSQIIIWLLLAVLILAPASFTKIGFVMVIIIHFGLGELVLMIERTETPSYYSC